MLLITDIDIMESEYNGCLLVLRRIMRTHTYVINTLSIALKGKDDWWMLARV